MANFVLDEWKRTTGRKFQNKKTGEIITRRQYDKQRDIKFEEKAAKNKAKNFYEQILRPARGRKSALKLAPEQKKIEAHKREENLKDKLIEKDLLKSTKHSKIPKTINKRSFKAGYKGRRFLVDFSADAVNELLSVARKYKGALGYTVAVVFVDERTGKQGAFELGGLRAFDMSFTDDDFLDAIDQIRYKKSYIIAKKFSVYIALKYEVYEELDTKRKAQLKAAAFGK